MPAVLISRNHSITRLISFTQKTVQIKDQFFLYMDPLRFPVLLTLCETFPSQNFGRWDEKIRSFSSLKLLSVHLLKKQKIFVHISLENSQFCILPVIWEKKRRKINFYKNRTLAASFSDFSNFWFDPFIFGCRTFGKFSSSVAGECVFLSKNSAGHAWAKISSYCSYCTGMFSLLSTACRLLKFTLWD